MSKEDKKSSPSPNHGLLFDPSHLLGVHSLAASGFPFPHLAHLPSPYSLLGQPPGFPGLFGGLGGIPNPLHAAALSHSLAAASYYGLPKHPGEMGSPPPPSPSPSPSSHKRGRSSRSSASASSSHRQASRSASSPSSSSPHPPASPYLPGWAMNGSSYPFSHSSSSVGEGKQTSSSSSRRSKQSSKSESREGSSKTAQAAHQHTLSSPLLTIPSAHSSLDHKSSADKSMPPEGFTFDPRAMITPYHMSPELAYLSQSLFLHRPDLGMPSPFLTASSPASVITTTAAAAPPTTSSTTASLGLEPGQLVSSSNSKSSSKHLTSNSSSLNLSTKASEKSRSDKNEKRSREKSVESSHSVHATNGIRSTVEDSRVPVKELEYDDTSDDRFLADPSHPSHMLDGDRKKRIADQIRKRVGMQDNMSELLSKHGLKHSDWLQSHLMADNHNDRTHHEEQEACSSKQLKRKENETPETDRRTRERELSDKINLEAELQKQEEQLRSLQKRYSIGEESMSSILDESCESIGHSEQDESKVDNSSASENVDVGSQSGSDSEGSHAGKRAADGSTDEGSPSKKRCTQLDERELVIPLEHGWNRQTIINGMGRRGIVGEVLYFAPCGKKMKTIPDVMRYLERNPNSDLGRENFSFNTKVNVGHFYEVRGGQGSQPVPLSDAEVLEKIEMSRGKRARMQMLARQKREKAAREQALARQVMEVKLKRRIELQVIERRKEKEQHKRDRQEEKMRIQEQLRREREMRAQQIIEARNRRQRELEEMRLADALQRNKVCERDMKRQQLVIMKEQERERRRQHLLLLKALEQRKRQEEKQTKERQREEKLNEKMKLREIKMHQRRVEMEVALELKKPIEDMELKNAKPLPKYSRLKSKLAGQPIADCLMAVEFLNNFGIALNLDKSSIPTLETLERGILNESEEDVEEFMSLVMHLLRFSLDDVGVPNPREAMTKLHQKITEMEMTDTTMSEVLRLFLKARGEKEMSEWLLGKPMEALNPTKKAAILAFLCNELLTSKVVTNEIDKHMDAINNLRRDKWVVEGQLRQLRVFQARKFNKIHKSTDRRIANNNNNMNQDDDTMCSSKLGSDDEDEKDDDDDKDDDEGSESDGSSSVMTNVSSNFNIEPLDENLTRDESDKRIEKLRKQHAAFRQKVFRASLRLRAINMGQDRYKRTYWVLPLTGGVYVEGMESGVPEDYAKESRKGSVAETVGADTKSVKAELHDDCQTSAVQDHIQNAGHASGAACESERKCVPSKDIATDCSERLEATTKESSAEILGGEQLNSKQNISSSPKDNSMLAGDAQSCLAGDSATLTFSGKAGSSEAERTHCCESGDKVADMTADSIPESLSVNHSTTTQPVEESGPKLIGYDKNCLESSVPKVTCSVGDEEKRSPSIGNRLLLPNQPPELDYVHRPNDTVLVPPSAQVKEMTPLKPRKEDTVEGAESSLKLVNGSHTVVNMLQDFTSFRQGAASVGGHVGLKALEEAQGSTYSESDCDAKRLASHVPDESKQNSDNVHSVSSLNLTIQTDNVSNGLETSEPEKTPQTALVADILKVPKVGGQRDTLVSLLNHSIHQAYQEEGPDEKHSKDYSKTSSLISPPSSLISPTPSSVVPSMLTSSLLFSAIPKLPQPAHIKKDSSLPLSSPSSTLIPLDFTQKQKYRTPVDSPLFNTTPIPAHTKPINPQPLPPFHPSAQASPLLDLAPPAAHSGHKTNKSVVLPPHAMSPAPPPHLPQPPYIPGLSHYPYGSSSASETLSSLASIISPPPAHHNPTTTSAISAPLLTSTPLQPRSTPTTSKTRSSYPKVDSILKGESPYSSSELLQQAASEVLRSAENQKLSPSISSASSTPQNSRLSSSLMTPAEDVSAYSSSEFLSENGNKSNSEVVDHKLWFSILPRMPCDEYSLTQPMAGQGSSSHSYPLSSLSASSSLSALSSYLNSPTAANLDALLPLIQSNPSLLSQDPIFTSLQLLTNQATPSVSPTPCSTPGLDSAGEFKVPPPPDMNPHNDPWEILRAAQGEAQPIPRNEQHGWWRIYDIAVLKSVMPCTLNRGIREKNLQRAIHRYLDYARLHCTYDSEKGEANPNSTEEQPSKGDKTIVNNNLKENKEESMDLEADKSSTDTLKCNNSTVANGIIKNEDTIKSNETLKGTDADTAAVPDKDVNQTEPAKLDAVVKEEVKDDTTGVEEGREQVDQKPNCDSETDDFVAPDDPDSWSVKCLHQIELAALDEVEALEERIFQASLQAKQGWRPHKDANMQLVDRSMTEVSDNESYPLDIAISRLLELEANIERRYLKPPLIRSVQLNLSSLSSHTDRTDGDFGDDETIPPGLLLWRQAVVSSESPAQLSLCTQLLAKSISWEKSIMRVTCQICRKDDNEAELLLCDGCDKGYHTYCFKPKMDNIPDGDWYCYECVSKASGTPHCVVCGIPGGRIVSCGKCPRYIHLECLNPPLPRMPKRWQCSNCLAEKGNPKRSKKKKEVLPTVQRINVTKLVLKEEPLDVDDLSAAPSTSGAVFASGLTSSASGERTGKKGSSKSDVSLSSGGNESPRQSGSEKKKRKKKEKDTDPMASPPKKKEKKERKDKKEKKPKEKKSEDGDKTSDGEDKKGNNKDLVACGKLLTELEKHEDGWPFLKPVNKKQFPSYKKYIKSPMDFNTARSKLKSKEYKHRQEFATDMRLIFNNCETFNEDDSDVGQAGFNLRQYFERRWLDMFPDDAS